MSLPSLFGWYKNIRLAYKLSAAFIVIITLLGIVIYNTINTIVTSTLYDQHRMRGETIAVNLAANSADLVLVEKRSQLHLLLGNAQQANKEVVYIFIIDGKDQVVAHTFPGGFPGGLLELSRSGTHDQNSRSSQLIETEEGLLLDISVPIMQASLGYVHLGFSRESILKKLQEIRQRIVVICLLAYVVAFFLAIYLSKRITRPLEALTKGAENIGRGNFSHRLTVESDDELGSVTKAFNLMIESLQEYIEKIISAEKRINEREQLYRSLVENVNLGITLIDRDHNIIMANSAQGKMFNKPPDNFIGKKCFYEFEKKEHMCTHCPGTKALETGLPQEVITEGKRDDGSVFTVKIKAFPVGKDYGNSEAFIEVVEDITEQIKTEQELLKVKKLESVGVLAGGIAHDFNNILAAILGNINLALLDTHLKDKTQERLVGAEKAAIRAKGLTQQLLTFAKGGEPVKEASSLENVIKDSANFVLVGDKVSSHYNIPNDLWLVDIDKGQMSQVVQNLVQNASHAMPEGGVVTISCKNVSVGEEPDTPIMQSGRYVKITIQDEGIGIPLDAAEKIFDPYFSTKHDGSGLGLAITHSIISKHYGHISVQSEPGSGAEFTIYLPASELSEEQKKKSDVHGKALISGKVLVMDDDAMVREIARAMLEELGCEVELSENGEEAVEMYKRSSDEEDAYDSVILDLTVPGGMGGEEAVREILAIDPDAKVIVSSGYSTDPIMANFKDYGFCSAIVKPYQLEEMSRVISPFLS